MNMKEAMQTLMEAVPTKQEVGQELGNRVDEAKGFFSEMVSDIGAELGRLGVQGQAEMAGALFNGNAYVPYGAGQSPPEPVQEQQIEREGMER